ncbi:MAG: TIGR03564 family F420-dependent LLM class oxidoreductase [Acidimicrobiales bacterium]|nr:TIGR03564 family F420-dependent LLM class oxidoreductase [Acidimicrobiales bacterium]
MKISWFDSATNVDDAVANAERARAAGCHRYWSPQISNADPMVVLGIVGREVADIRVGTSVVAMQTTFAQNLAAQARTIAQASGGRFTLGLGASHQPAMEMAFGIPWTKPYTHMVEYLDALLPLLEDQHVSTTGEFVTHHASLNVPGPTPDVMLAALGPKMLKLAADRTAGTITWMTGPKTIESHIRPGIGGGHIAAGVPIFITDDVPAAREFAGNALAIYGQLPSYRAMLDREGMDGPADMVLAGDPETVRAGLEAYKAAGVDEIAMNVLGTGESLDSAWELAASLGGVM